jgi:signal peptidase I
MEPKEQLKNKSGIELSLHLFNTNNAITLRLSGYSMFPFLREGDVGHIQKCEIDLLKTGDVVVFKHHDKMIAHRLLKKEIINAKLLLITKGDTSLKPDASFDDELYVGKLVSFTRNEKKVNLQTVFNYWYGYLIAKTSFFNTPFFVANKKVYKRLKHIFN